MAWQYYVGPYEEWPTSFVAILEVYDTVAVLGRWDLHDSISVVIEPLSVSLNPV